jgi:hypothetical protein
MLTLVQLEDLLRLNEELTLEALCSDDFGAFKRLCELQLHRSIVKDMLLELLKEELMKASSKEAA